MKRRHKYFSSVIGPGLFIPPVFLALIVCVYPRPTPPRMPYPHIDEYHANEHLSAVIDRVERISLSDQEKTLLKHRSDLQSLRGQTTFPPPEEIDQKLARIEFRLLRSCFAVARQRGKRRLTEVGEVASLRLTQAISRIELSPREAIRESRRLGGIFVTEVFLKNLMDQKGTLTVHPIVIFTLAQVGFRKDCDLEPEYRFSKAEKDGIDVYRIAYGSSLDFRQRYESISRFAERNESFSLERAQMSLYLSSSQYEKALLVAESAVRANPDDRELINNMLFIRGLIH